MDSISTIFSERLIINCYMICLSNQETNNFIQKRFASSLWGKEEVVGYFYKNFTGIELKVNDCIHVINLVNDRDVKDYSIDKPSNKFVVKQWIDIAIYILEGRINHSCNDIDVRFRFVAPKNIPMKELVKRINVNSLKKIYITHIEEKEECWLHG